MASSVILVSESSKTVFNSLDHGRRDLPQAAVSRVAHQDMPTTLRSGQSIARLIGPEEVDVAVEVGLRVPGRHPREAPKVALGPGAQVVHHLHPPQVYRVAHVGPVRLALEPAAPDQHAVFPLRAMDEQRPGRFLPPMAFLARAEHGFPWPQATASAFLWMSTAT